MADIYASLKLLRKMEVRVIKWSQRYFAHMEHMALLDATALSTAATQLLECLHNSAACARTLAQQRQTALEERFDDNAESFRAHSDMLVVLSRMCGVGILPTTTSLACDPDDVGSTTVTAHCTLPDDTTWICLDEYPFQVSILSMQPWHAAYYKGTLTWALDVRFYMVSSSGKRISARIMQQDNRLDVGPVQKNWPRKNVFFTDNPDVFNVRVHVHRFDEIYKDIGLRIQFNSQTLYKAVNTWP